MSDNSKKLRQISIFESLHSVKRQKISDSEMNESEEIRIKALAAAEERIASKETKTEISKKPLSLKDYRRNNLFQNHTQKQAAERTESDGSANVSPKQPSFKKPEVNGSASCSAKESTVHSDSEGSFQNSADLFPDLMSPQEDCSSGYSGELFTEDIGTQSQPLIQNDEEEEEEENENEMKFLNRSPSCLQPLPKLEPLENHSIMFLPHVRFGEPPRPYPSSYRDIWKPTAVRMPCSPYNKYPVGTVGGETIIESRWELIGWSLRENITSSKDLEEAIMKYNNQYARKWNFRGLHAFLNKCLSKAERDHFFEEVLPPMVELALDIPSICTQPVPLLKKGKDHKVTLTQKQIGCLLLNAFFCTFPRRTLPRNNKLRALSEYANFPDINFNRLFASPKYEITQRSAEKLKCLLNYFRRITAEIPTGTVSFHRQCVRESDLPKWYESNRGIRTAVIRSSGLIETEGRGMLQVDFANRLVGGGVLGYGCVQEEIRFVICPELIVSRLFVESLEPNEVLIVTGVEQYNQYSGYADTFKWEGDFKDVTPRDPWGRRYTQVVAMDAMHFRDTEDQFKPSSIKRELNKAYCGFYENCLPVHLPAISTGNWGCGAFRGNPNLKFLIQLMAAAQAGRSLLYLTFGNKKLKSELRDMYDFLNDQNLSVGDVWRLLIQYAKYVSLLNKKEARYSLYDFIYSQFVTKEEECKQGDLKQEEPLINDSDKQAAENLIKDIENESGNSSTDIECLDG